MPELGGVIGQAQVLWPDDKEVHALKERWKDSLQRRAMRSSMGISEWRKALHRLELLGDTLNRKGRTAREKELGLLVWNIRRDLEVAAPTEEILYQIGRLKKDNKPVPEMLDYKIVTRINQLQADYLLQKGLTPEVK